MSAGQALIAAAAEALRTVPGLSGVHEAMPVQAAPPYATLEAGLEADWGHKSGGGRELRLTVTLRDSGERPARLRALAAAAQAALAGLAAVEGWQLVNLAFVRGLTVAEGAGKWLAVLDYRARLLET
ncbi:MAG TPA: DUF3168 domain-containing protein [Allosphingosinicella sp.]|nr:DUF3168 domain-containing protein [Allosphingosinicella sp.]